MTCKEHFAPLTLARTAMSDASITAGLLRTSLTGTTPSYSGMPGSGNGKDPKLAALCDASMAEEENRKAYEALRLKHERELAQIINPRYRAVLTAFYLDNLNMSAIAKALYCSLSSAKRLRTQAEHYFEENFLNQ